MPQPPRVPKTFNSHSRPWLQCRSGPQPPLAPTISPLALAAIGRMALVSNCTTTSANYKERLGTVAIRPMVASARGKMVGARGELLGTRGGCGPDLHCSQGRLWLLDVFRQGWLRHLWSLFRLQFQNLGVHILKLYHLKNKNR